MAQYILLIQGNAKSKPTADEWDRFIAVAKQSGLFKGGSAMGDRAVIGDARSAKSSNHIEGYMRFDATDKQLLLDLLQKHPVVVHGGSVELCELPKSSGHGANLGGGQ